MIKSMAKAANVVLGLTSASFRLHLPLDGSVDFESGGPAVVVSCPLRRGLPWDHNWVAYFKLSVFDMAEKGRARDID